MVDTFKTSANYELELRLGRSRGTAFVASNPEEMHSKADALLTHSSHLQSSQWRESHDFFFLDRGLPVRSSVAFDADTLSVVTRHCRKKVVSTVDFRVGDVSVRAALSLETPLQECGEATVPTTHVRIKQRRSHVLCDAEGNPYVTYDLSRTWSGRTKTEAEVRQRSNAPSHEIEVELLHNERYAARSSAHIARSLILKAEDLVRSLADDESSPWMLVLDPADATDSRGAPSSPSADSY